MGAVLSYNAHFEAAIAHVLDWTGTLIKAEELDHLADLIGDCDPPAAEECREFAKYLRQRKIQ